MIKYALTLKHPWPFAIFRLGKDIENRNWKLPEKYLGQTIAIHGGAFPKGHKTVYAVKQDVEHITTQILTHRNFKIDPELKSWWKDNPKLQLKDWIMPGLIGSVKIVDCVYQSNNPWFSGRYGFVFEEAKLFEKPIPAKGKLGFWSLGDLARQIK